MWLYSWFGSDFLLIGNLHFMVATTGKVHEINVAKSIDYQPGSMICMDRGYTDYDWWEDLTQSGRLSYFLNGLSRI